jgi:hypothetical protein
MTMTERIGEQGPANPEAGPLQQLATRMRAIVEEIPAMEPAFVVTLEAILQSQRSPELHSQLVEHYAEHRRLAAFYKALAAGAIAAALSSASSEDKAQ